MAKKYMAKLYFGDRETIDESGDDVEQLYVWLLTQANDKLGDVHGEIISNDTQEVVKKFKKCPPD